MEYHPDCQRPDCISCQKSSLNKIESEHLGYWITQSGITSVTKKMEEIQKIETFNQKKSVETIQEK
jgi:hypothetical protein